MKAGEKVLIARAAQGNPQLLEELMRAEQVQITDAPLYEVEEERYAYIDLGRIFLRKNLCDVYKRFYCPGICQCSRGDRTRTGACILHREADRKSSQSIWYENVDCKGSNIGITYRISEKCTKRREPMGTDILITGSVLAVLFILYSIMAASRRANLLNRRRKIEREWGNVPDREYVSGELENIARYYQNKLKRQEEEKVM